MSADANSTDGTNATTAGEAGAPVPPTQVPNDVRPGRRPPSRVRRILVRGGLGGLALTGLGAAGVASLFVYHGRDLPDISTLKNYRPNLVSRIADAKGARVEDFWETDRDYVTYDRLPKQIVQAFVAAEDGRFFEHGGVDYLATARAAATSALSLVTGERLVGGSTITQQVAKNLFLSRDRRIRRKVREIMLAWRIDDTLSKEKILEIYLNEIYLGRQAYGVAAAARAYFGKTLDDLTLSEAAFLAGLPKAPSRYDPLLDRAASRARRDYVIDRMREEGYIGATEAAAAKLVRLVTRNSPPRRREDSRYFADAIKRDLLKRVGSDDFRRGGYRIASTIDLRLQAIARTALRDGLIAYDRRHGWRGPLTTIPAEKRRHWQEALRSVTPPPGRGDWRIAVVLEVDNARASIGVEGGARGVIPLSELRWARPEKTFERQGKPAFQGPSGPAISRASDVLEPGDVVLVEKLRASPGAKDGGGKDAVARYTLRQVPKVTGALVAMDPHTGRVLAMTGGFSFNLHQYGAASRAERQPGSAFKPFVYLAALEANLSPATVVHDEPFEVTLADGSVYRPNNYSGKFMGAITLRRALEQSRNTVAVRVASHVGLSKVAELGRKFGVAEAMPPIYSMALGSVETTPLRLARAFAMLANGGKPVQATLTDRVVDRDGKVIYRHTVPACPTCGHFRPEAKPASPVKGTVTPVADPRSIYQVISLMRGVVQRGTGSVVASLGLPIAGKTGTTNGHRDAWFVGFTTDLVVAVWVGFEDNRSLGPREQGGVTAAPIFRDFMAAALKGKKVADFEPPKGIVRAPVVVITEDDEGFETSQTVYEYLKRGNARRVLALNSLVKPDEGGDDGFVQADARATQNTRPVATPRRASAPRDWQNRGSMTEVFENHNAFR